MDRNDNYNLHCVEEVSSLSARRAWIEILYTGDSIRFEMSLSARRAWIEILYTGDSIRFEIVALRKESVDRNNNGILYVVTTKKSLSARRAWIEILGMPKVFSSLGCRSPQGERG